MTNVSGEAKNSATGLMNIVRMSSYPTEQSFPKGLRDCSTSFYKTVYNWNLSFLSGKDSIILLSSLMM